MSNLQVFNHKKFGQVRTIIEDNEPWFVGKDIAKCLGYKDTSDALKRHIDDEDKLTRCFTDTGQSRRMIVINESGLYSLILSSQLPDAKKFKRWVTTEILPTIRKTGGYVANDGLFVDTYLPFADEATKAMFLATLETVRGQNELIKQQQRQIQHKEDVIIGLVDDIELTEKRQVINRVVRYKGANFQERWKELYRQFEMKYHVSLDRRLESYNATHSPKLKNKLDYIDKVMGKIPELYEIACKLYENDVKELVNELYEIA
jgi:prophage antirepressor-like protein